MFQPTREKVDQQIYKIHRYFLVRESEFFKDMFSLPQGDSASVEGENDEHPIPIPDTTMAGFKSLLRFFYFGYGLCPIGRAVGSS